MKPLTERAQANVDAGATSGPGTLVCRKCDGPKEEGRINSGQCGACSRTNQGLPAKERDAKGEPMRNLRTMVPPWLFAQLEAGAASHNVTLAAHVRACLAEHVNEGRDRTIPREPALGKAMTGAEWSRLAEWFLERGEDPRRAGCLTKQDALRWARGNGYDQ